MNGGPKGYEPTFDRPLDKAHAGISGRGQFRYEKGAPVVAGVSLPETSNTTLELSPPQQDTVVPAIANQLAAKFLRFHEGR